MSTEYDVGYGKPPPEHRFKPGQSGNPKGRQRIRQTHAEIVAVVRDELVPVTINGKRRLITSFEALLRAMFARCMQKGRPSDLEKLIDLMERRGAAPAEIEAVRTREAADKVIGTIVDVFRKTAPARRDVMRRDDEEACLVLACSSCRKLLEERWTANRADPRCTLPSTLQQKALDLQQAPLAMD